MNKICLWFVFGALLLMGCTPRNYFLFNSDMMSNYNRTTGNLEFVWTASIKHLAVCPDTIPKPIVSDSFSIVNDSIILSE